MSWVYRPLERPVYEASEATVSEASEAVVSEDIGYMGLGDVELGQVMSLSGFANF